MATLEELRAQRLQELQTRQTPSPVDDARTKRLEELRTQKRTFTEKPAEIQNTIDTGRTASQALLQTTAVNTLPSVAGIGATAATMAAAGSIVPGIGTLGGGLLGLAVGIGTAIFTKKAQDKVLEVTKGEEWKRNLDQSIAEDRKEHPFATFAGETVPSLIAFRPSPTTLKQAFNFSKRALTNPKSLSKHTSTLQGKTELDALINVAVGSGIDVSLETYQQAREGDFNALRIISSAVVGGVISDPNRLGVKLGFKPTGDAVIEEYNKFGSQTPAAKILTEGDIPVIDRSSDALVMDRKELSAILRGEYEANRFTDPRIIRAEKISGTIDKDVTPESDLNIYRLDGREGPMRVGERVTANPHIADVFGGRINPEAVVKAGDLVRTSKGDYVYIPKDQIAGEAILPPVTNAVERKVQKDVLKKELTNLEKLRAEKIGAKRLADEPARLQKEAEELAIKEKADAEAKFQKETEQAQATKVRLEENVAKARAEKIKKIAEDKIRVEAEHKTIDKNTDKEVESITTQLRKDINAATLDHVKRLTTAKTKVQKTKENIRFSNLKATLTAKSIKAKKKVREIGAESKNKVQSNVQAIRQQTDEAISNLKKEIKSVPKPKLGVVKESKKESTPAVKNVEKTTQNIEPQSVSKKEELVTKAPKTITIGTKTVKSESIIKNAVQEAREHSKKAQELDPDVTEQMGTTFVEQRELSAKLVTEKGYDEALKFAIEASDADVRKLNLDRSALYETLYKMAVKEGQFLKYRDDLEQLAILTSDEVSVAAQKTSLARLATENDPFRRVAATLKQLVDNEKKKRGSVFTKEVDELYAKLKAAGTEEDLNKIINDNLC